MDMTVACIVCEKTLSHVFQMENDNQPNDAACAFVYGQYGSVAFDPMDGSYLEFNICDECLVAKAQRGVILIGRTIYDEESDKAVAKEALKVWHGPKQFRYHVDINES